MHDSMEGRRKRGAPPKMDGRKEMRREIQAMREAGVPQKQLAETLSKRFRSPAAQKLAIRRLIAKASGQNARRMADE